MKYNQSKGLVNVVEKREFLFTHNTEDYLSFERVFAIEELDF